MRTLLAALALLGMTSVALADDTSGASYDPSDDFTPPVVTTPSHVPFQPDFMGCSGGGDC